MKQFFIVFILLISCRTTQQIRQEQLYDNLTNQVSKGQELSAVAIVRMDRIENQFNTFSGTLQEFQHQISTNTKSNEDVAIETNKKIEGLTKDLETMKKDILALQKSAVDLQKSISATRKAASVATSSTPTYDEAVKNYRSAKYKIAGEQFKYLLDNKKVTGDKLAHTYHNLGMITYMDKKYKDTQMYFSKLYTSFPKTGYVPNGLLYLAKSFHENKQSKEAIATLNQLIKDHPTSKQIDEAKKMLANIQK